MAPNMGAGDSHHQATFDAKRQERENGRTRGADSGEEKEEQSHDGGSANDRAGEGDEVEAQTEVNGGDLTAAEAMGVKMEQDAQSASEVEEVDSVQSARQGE